MGNIVQKLAFPVPNPPYEYQTEPVYIETENYRIPMLYFNKDNRDTKDNKASNSASKDHKLIIFSHGNATDLAASESFLHYLKDELNISVLGYEYIGYGYAQSNNITSSIDWNEKPSEEGCYKSLEFAVEYAIKDLNYKMENIILMGQSIGSGPTCEIAKRISERQAKLAGVILVCPFRSAVKVVTDNYIVLKLMDFFQNDCKIDKITCPILIIHGKNDEVISYEHSEYMYDLCNNNKDNIIHLYLVANANHNNIFKFDRTIKEIKEFIKQ